MEQITVKRAAGYHPQQKKTQTINHHHQQQQQQPVQVSAMNSQEKMVNDMIKEVGRVFAARDLVKKGLEREIAELEDQLHYVESETFKQAEALGVCCAATSYHKYQIEAVSAEIRAFNEQYIDTYEEECDKFKAISGEVNEIADAIYSDLEVLRENYAGSVAATLPVARATFRVIIADHANDQMDLASKRERALHLSHEVKQLQTSLDHLVLALESATVENEELETENRILTTQVFAVDALIEEASAEAEALKVVLLESTTAMDDALHSKEHDLQRAKSEFDQHTDKLEALKLTRSLKEEALTAARAKLQEALASAATSAEALGELSIALRAEEEQHEAIQLQLDAVGAQTAQVEGSRAQAQWGLDELLCDAAAMRARASDVAAQLPLAVNELMRLGAEVPNLKIELNAREEQRRLHLLSLSEQTARHSAAAKALSERYCAEKLAADALRIGVAKAQGEADAAGTALEQAKAELAAWVQRRSLAEERVRESQAHARVEERKAAVAALRAECDNLAAQVVDKSRQAPPFSRRPADSSSSSNLLPPAAQKSLNAAVATEVKAMEEVLRREHALELQTLQGHLQDLRSRMASSTFLKREHAEVEQLRQEIARCADILSRRKRPTRQQQQQRGAGRGQQRANKENYAGGGLGLGAFSPSPEPRKQGGKAPAKHMPSPDFLFDEYVPKYK